MNPKYNIGQEVVVKSDVSKEVHTIVGMFLDVRGWSYRVTAKELDISQKQVVDGYSFYLEDELEVYKGKK